jgi:hypothetical protein
MLIVQIVSRIKELQVPNFLVSAQEDTGSR